MPFSARYFNGSNPSIAIIHGSIFVFDRFCNTWYSVLSAILVVPSTIVVVLYFILFVFFSQSNSISRWLSEDSVDAGKCDTVSLVYLVSLIITDIKRSFLLQENW